MFLRFFIMLVLLSAGLGGLFYWKTEQDKTQKTAMAGFKRPPTTVEAEAAKNEQRTPVFLAIGSLAAVRGIEIKSEKAGRIIKLGFESGQTVAADDLLVQLDDSGEQAELRALRAELKLAELDWQRDSKLGKQQSIAASVLDKTRTQLEKARADIARVQASIDKKQIRAPFAGHLGLRQVSIGDYLEEAQSITNLQALNPLYVNFALPEKALSDLHPGQKVEVHLDTFPNEVFHAEINALDAQVNVRTRNINVQATLANPQNRFLPGMFAKLRVLRNNGNDVVTVPETAVTYSLYGDSVFVVEDKDGAQHVKRRYITTGANENGRVGVLKGLQAGELVVVSGGLKLRDGAEISIKQANKPD